jgi:hypothetical protein
MNSTRVGVEPVTANDFGLSECQPVLSVLLVGKTSAPIGRTDQTRLATLRLYVS